MDNINRRRRRVRTYITTNSQTKNAADNNSSNQENKKRRRRNKTPAKMEASTRNFDREDLAPPVSADSKILNIHGIESMASSDSDESGKSEFDESYYKHQPKTLVIDTNKLVKITPNYNIYNNPESSKSKFNESYYKYQLKPINIDQSKLVKITSKGNMNNIFKENISNIEKVTETNSNHPRNTQMFLQIATTNNVNNETLKNECGAYKRSANASNSIKLDPKQLIHEDAKCRSEKIPISEGWTADHDLYTNLPKRYESVRKGAEYYSTTQHPQESMIDTVDSRVIHSRYSGHGSFISIIEPNLAENRAAIPTSGSRTADLYTKSPKKYEPVRKGAEYYSTFPHHQPSMINTLNSKVINSNCSGHGNFSRSQISNYSSQNTIDISVDSREVNSTQIFATASSAHVVGGYKQNNLSDNRNIHKNSTKNVPDITSISRDNKSINNGPDLANIYLDAKRHDRGSHSSRNIISKSANGNGKSSVYVDQNKENFATGSSRRVIDERRQSNLIDHRNVKRNSTNNQTNIRKSISNNITNNNSGTGFVNATDNTTILVHAKPAFDENRSNVAPASSRPENVGGDRQSSRINHRNINEITTNNLCNNIRGESGNIPNSNSDSGMPYSLLENEEKVSFLEYIFCCKCCKN